MSDLERRALEKSDGIRSFVDENSRELILGFTALVILQFAGVIDVGLPDWWPIVGVMIASAGITGYLASDKIAELIPKKDGILLVAFEADGKGGEIWELHEATWEEMNVDGTLYEWSESPRRIYECRSYDPKTNHAVANWRESEPASTLAQERTVEDVYAAVRELRQDLEPSAAEARELRRRIRGIVRRLDEERTKARARQLDEATLDEGIDTATVSEIIDQELPHNLHPDAGRGTDEPNANGELPQTNGEDGEFEIADIEPLEPEINAEDEVPHGL